MLIILSGLPATGKSTIARDVAARLGATYLRIDSIEQALANSTLRIRPAADAGYTAGYALAEDNLRLGNTVVADSVNPIRITRDAWLDVAGRCGCAAVEIEVACSDATQHRRRVESRTVDVPGLRLPTWQDVLDRDYEPWHRDRIRIDTAGRTVSDSVDEVMSFLTGSSS